MIGLFCRDDILQKHIIFRVLESTLTLHACVPFSEVFLLLCVCVVHVCRGAYVKIMKIDNTKITLNEEAGRTLRSMGWLPLVGSLK